VGKIKKKKKLGPLILETYDNIIRVVGKFTDSAARELKSETIEDSRRNADLKEAYGIIIITSVTQECSIRSYYLKLRLKTN